ncbi:MAG: hypothetical protein IJ694_07665 [Acidaminococcaceae bacterium]|nr:hypothetical protein [Acidaminococcaceae bacterium]
MNRIYKVIWNKARNCYMAVAEFVKRQGKSGSVLNRRHIAAALAAVAICAAPAGALANSGGHLEGITYIGDAPDYKVIIDSDTNGHVYGRRESGTIAVSGASVTVTSGTVGNLPYTGNVYGGYSHSGNAENNTVILSKEEGKEAPVLKGTLYGGYSVGGSVTKNEVTVNGGEVKSYVQGGYSEKANAENNTVTVSGGTVVGVSGGRSLRANAGNNTVTITGGTVGNLPYTGNVYGGGSASDGDAISNTVAISGGTVNGNVYGGQSVLGDAKANEVTISGGTLGRFTYVYGGLSEQGAAGGTAAKDGNKVTITGGTVGTVQGGYSLGDASYNSVVIAGGTVQGNAYGGESTQGNALNNSVTVKEGTAGWVFGGHTKLTGMKAAGNKVTITGGTVSTVVGGLVDDKDENGDSVGGSSNPASATENTVEIRGGTVNGDVYGGRSMLGPAERNTVILAKEGKEAPVINGTLYGGVGGSVKNNTLQVEAAGLSAPEIRNFDNYKFVLPSDIKAGDNTMLKLKGQGENLTIDGNKVSVTLHELNLKHGESVSLLSVESGQTISGSNLDRLWEQPFQDASPDNSVVLRGTERHRLYVDTGNTRLNYAIDHIAVDTVQLGATDWQKDATLLHGTSDAYLYDKVTALDTAKFAMRFAKPETVAVGDSMTLLAANNTLRDMVAETKQNAYQFTPVAGVTVDAAITGSLVAKSGNVTYTVDENRAGKLTFGNVQWKDSGALLKRPGNITFAGAEVDTQKIHFTNVEQLKANQKMTLVSDFGNSVGTITGDHYTVGTTLHGKGKASLQGSDLVYTVETGTHKHDPAPTPDPVPEAQPQTHNVLMAMTAGMQMVKQGGDFMDKAASGLGASENTDADGGSVFAAVGGGAGRTETGSHVKTHTWNGIVAVGASRKIESGTFQWGVFGEYGKGNYSLHNDTGRGDGDAHYAGGGLLAKWTNKHDVYTEVGVRLGRMSDKASDLLEDADGNRYGYDIHTNYYGAHLGFGKVFRYKGWRSLDVYGKYFYTKRDGADFEAGGHYSLDSVKSSVLRVGARYGTSDKRWNWYGGLAYEYEFDGKSTGTADGRPIRAASIKGGSVRGEVGLRMEATQKNPWQADISLTGYAGRHRGFGGNVSVAYTF